jgi:hypothetical protein
MRESAASIKSPSNKGVGQQRSAPAEGSLARSVFDLLAPGKTVSVNDLRKITIGYSDAIRYLAESYDLDIRYLGHGFYCRVGEWDGKIYIDHVAQKVAG